jgi:hypothetical protein
MKKLFKTKYPLWEYPIILIFLVKYIKVWEFWRIRRRVKALIAWRRDIGIITKDHKVTKDDILSFGHWIVGMWLIEKW